jgi:hypothetical protein
MFNFFSRDESCDWECWNTFYNLEDKLGFHGVDCDKMCSLINLYGRFLHVSYYYGYVQEVLVRLNLTLDMLLQSDVVKYEFFGLMCDLEGMETVYNQEADCSLHFTFDQWDLGDHLDLKFRQWDPGKFMVEAGFYNLEDKVDLEGVGNDRILRIMSINVVTKLVLEVFFCFFDKKLVLEVIMTHLNLEGSRRYIVRG